MHLLLKYMNLSYNVFHPFSRHFRHFFFYCLHRHLDQALPDKINLCPDISGPHRRMTALKSRSTDSCIIRELHIAVANCCVGIFKSQANSFLACLKCDIQVCEKKQTFQTNSFDFAASLTSVFCVSLQRIFNSFVYTEKTSNGETEVQQVGNRGVWLSLHVFVCGIVSLCVSPKYCIRKMYMETPKLRNVF